MVGRVLDSDILQEIEITYILSDDNGGESVRLGYSAGTRNYIQTGPVKMLISLMSSLTETTHELTLENCPAVSAQRSKPEITISVQTVTMRHTVVNCVSTITPFASLTDYHIFVINE